MTNNPTVAADIATSAIDNPQPTLTRTCPACSAVYTEQELAEASYRCKKCGLEMAHVETAPNGTTRRVLAWLHPPGDVLLDRYTVEKVLGKGGFATTYLVSDLNVGNRKRALKEIPKPLYDSAEEEMLSHLDHPAIPDIVDRGESSDTIYLVLKFGGGRTLENERQKRGGRIPLNVFLPWFQQLGGVISYLHSQTPPIIHRDLKPDNVLLDEHDRIMLIDFGIAKQSADDGQTRTIARAATHGYSPPEQALGTGTDPRSDVYSLAATAYALLTGRVPPPSHIRVAGRELEAPAQLVPDLPNNVSEALTDALNLNINLRPQSVTEFIQRVVGVTSPADGTVDSQEFSPASSRTVMVGELPVNYTEQATSVRIGTEKVTVGPATSANKAPRKGRRTALVLMLATIGAGSYWYYQQQNTEGPDTPPIKTSKTQADEPASTTTTEKVIAGKHPVAEGPKSLADPLPAGSTPANVTPVVIPKTQLTADAPRTPGPEKPLMATPAVAPTTPHAPDAALSSAPGKPLAVTPAVAPKTPHAPDAALSSALGKPLVVPPAVAPKTPHAPDAALISVPGKPPAVTPTVVPKPPQKPDASPSSTTAIIDTNSSAAAAAGATSATSPPPPNAVVPPRLGTSVTDPWPAVTRPPVRVPTQTYPRGSASKALEMALRTEPPEAAPLPRMPPRVVKQQPPKAAKREPVIRTKPKETHTKTKYSRKTAERRSKSVATPQKSAPVWGARVLGTRRTD